MRPIRLTMQAFGPYAGVQVLDMEALGETGIYAITGETGAGKTTIFDAIVYALYGSGSGEDRSDGRSLRSVAASPDLETRVELEFVSGGKRYSIARRPAQRVAGRRGGEPVERLAAQRLTMPDGKTVYTRARDIEERIEGEILGVTKAQFCQIVMIAQGEFRKLLQADTKDRTVILRRIFRTERFEALSRRLDRLAKDKYAALCESRGGVSYALKALSVPGDSPLGEALSALRAVEPGALILEEAEALAGRVVEADEADQSAAQARLQAVEAERDRAGKALDRAREQAEKRAALAQLEAALAGQEARFTQAKRALEAAEAERPGIERLAGEIATETQALPRYAAIGDREEAARKVEAELARAEGDQKAALREEETLKARRDALAREAEGLADAPQRKLDAADALNGAEKAGEALARLRGRALARAEAEQALRAREKALAEAEARERDAEAALRALGEELEGLGNTQLALARREDARKRLEEEAGAVAALGKLLGERDAARERFEEARKAYLRQESAAQALRREAGEARRRYNDNIAGILARDLAEGEPCPVCGSVHHPHPAAIAGPAASEKEVRAAEEQAAAAQEAGNALALESASCRKDLDHCRDGLAERLPEVPEEAWEEEIDRREKANAEALERSAADIRAAREADERAKQLRETLIPQAQAGRDAAARAKGEGQSARSEALARREAAEAEVASAAAGVMPSDWTELDLSDAIAESDRRLQALREAVEQARKDMERLAEIGEARRELEEALAAATARIAEAGSRVAALAEEGKGRRREVDALRAELPHETEAACRASIGEKTARRAALEAAIEAARIAADDLKTVIAGTRGRIQALAGELEGAEPGDAAALEAEFTALQAACDAAAKAEKDVHARRSNNVARRADLLRCAGEARTLEREYRMMKDVSDTVSGNVSGNKITLEAYVQTAYFDRILRYANRRLIHMSRHQYDLARQDPGDGDGRSKKGLELDVVDHANGRRRAVGTLSGGESFLASLSFALGMSDAIQASAASAVQLDTMFVDEGFGSLSESFLGLVMDELNDTAHEGHRLIGVISHVDEVKEGIDRRIEVTKRPDGVSRAEIR